MEGAEPKDEVYFTGKTISIKRPVYTLDEYNKKYVHSESQQKSIPDRIYGVISARNLKKVLMSFIPVAKVMRKYKIRKYLVGDFLAGLTVSFMHLPQGMAFGLLSSLRPIYGLYSTFFPVLFYAIFGTCPYISFGTNAVMALLTQTVVEREASSFVTGYEVDILSNTTLTGPSESEILQVKVGTAMTLSLISGIFLTAMGTLRLGFLTSYLSSSFIGGFTTAAAVHIASSQVPKIFGIKTESYAGPGKLVLLYIDLFRKIAKTNLADLIISVISMTILLAVKLGINERYRHKMKIPVPIDLVVVIIATLISFFAKLEQRYDVEIVGPIPSGFSAPYVPKFNNVGNFVTDAIVIGILSLAITITMAKLTATKQGIKIDDSQEIFAYGISTFLSGFFGCFPAATAPPRTMLLVSLGAKTSLNAIPTCVVFLLIILVIGRLFQTLPIAVLAAMIIVSMKELLLQYRNLVNIWAINKFDFVIWVVTNSASILIDLDYGLTIGIGVSFLLVIVQNQTVSGHVMAKAIPDDILYISDWKTERNVKIFQFPTNLYFATAERFKHQIYRKIFNPQDYIKALNKMQNQCNLELASYANEINNEIQIVNGTGTKREHKGNETNTKNVLGIRKPKTVIIDFSPVQYIDMTGINILIEVIKEYKAVEISVYLTGVSMASEKALTRSGLFELLPKSNVYHGVFDALEASKPEYVYHL